MWQYSRLREMAESYIAKHPQLRLGQAYMSALAILDKELYDKVKNTDNDPFYDDSKMKDFTRFLIFGCGVA